MVSNYPFLKIYVTKVSQLFSNEQHVGVLENQPSSNSNSVDEKIAIAIALLVFQQLVELADLCDPRVTDSLAVIVQKVQNLIYWVHLVRSVYLQLLLSISCEGISVSAAYIASRKCTRWRIFHYNFCQKVSIAIAFGKTFFGCRVLHHLHFQHSSIHNMLHFIVVAGF